MTLVVNGVDMIPYVFRGGFKWQRSDVDDADSGRNTLDAEMHRNRIATKIRLDITCRPLTLAESSIVLSAIMPVWVQVTYTDPQLGADVTKTMYSNNNPASFAFQRSDGTEYWNGITFPLIER